MKVKSVVKKDETLTHFVEKWLPFFVAAIVILVTLLLWYSLFRLSHSHILYLQTHQTKFLIEDAYGKIEPSITKLIPWITLVLGISLAILIFTTIRLALLIKKRAQHLSVINRNLKKEIKERIHAEETKQKLEKALLQGQKLQAIGTLAGGIAHDFNNLIYAIRGYVEMAQEDVSKDSLIHKNLGKVLDATKRGQDLVGRILAFSRRQQHEHKPLWIKETLENVLSLLKPTIPASVILNVVTKINDCVINGNETQLHQVIVNLINNAVDAMDSEGTITIQLSRINAHDEILNQFPNKADQNYCKIKISDTGHGMEPSTMERIFEPFFTTKEVGKGTGLGLSTVHAIVKEHHGEIIVSSELGRGSSFTLFLPEYQNESDQVSN